MSVAYLGVGSNLDAEQNIRLAISELRSRYILRRCSPVYRSKALGFSGEDFLNAVACIETDLSPYDLCQGIEDIHELAGRRRTADKFVSRTLDIDLLMYDRLVTAEPGMKLPRPDVLQFSFVLKPLADIAPDLIHPETGQRIDDHWREFDAESHRLTKIDLAL